MYFNYQYYNYKKTKNRIVGSIKTMRSQPSNPKIDKQILQLYYTFTYYCAFADRQNYQTLKIQNFKRLLSDAQIIEKTHENMQLDLLFAHTKHHSNGIDFQTFLEILPQIAKIIYPDDSQKGIRTIVRQNFHALYQFLYANTQLGDCIKYLSKNAFSQSCFLLLKSLSSTLYRIYDHYFDINSVKLSNKRSEIFKKITNFTKNFEITPQMMTKTQSFIVFNYIADQNNTQAQSIYKEWFLIDKNNKNMFSYYHFIQFIMVASLVANKKLIEVQISQFRKLVNFLQLLEVSAGFARFCKIQKVNLHLIANQKLIKQLQGKSNSIPMFGITSIASSPQKKTNSLQLDEIIVSNYSSLYQKFILFCLHGQTIGTSSLTHKKAIDIIKFLQLGLKQSEIQVYLASLNIKSIQFQSFILMLQKISEKQQIDITQIIQKFLSMTFAQQDSLRTSRNNAPFSRTQYRNCIAMVQLLEQLLKYVFKLQAQPSNTPQIKNPIKTPTKTQQKVNKQQNSTQQMSFISLNSYLKIMHEFQLSPLYITKQSLIEIFRKSIKKSYDFMSFYQFKDSFVIAVPYIEVGLQNKSSHQHEVSYHSSLSVISEQKQLEAKPETKMVVMFERINESRGAQKLIKSFPTFHKEVHMTKFRKIFHQFYPQNEKKTKKNMPKQQKLMYQKSKVSTSRKFKLA